MGEKIYRFCASWIAIVNLWLIGKDLSRMGWCRQFWFNLGVRMILVALVWLPYMIARYVEEKGKKK